MSDQLEQRVLTILKEPATKVGKDKKTTFVSMLAEFGGEEQWYYIDDDCPQWEDYHEGDIVNAQVKDWGKGRAVKKMQKVEGDVATVTGEVKAAPRARSSEFRTPAQIIRTDALSSAVAVLGAGCANDDYLGLASIFEDYITNGRGRNRAVEAAQQAAQALGGQVMGADDGIPEW